jgi:hypothetical protein
MQRRLFATVAITRSDQELGARRGTNQNGDDVPF